MKVHPSWLANQKSVAGFQNRIQGLGQMYNICAVSVIKGFNATNLFFFFLSLTISLISVFVCQFTVAGLGILISAAEGNTRQGEGMKALSKNRFKLLI